MKKKLIILFLIYFYAISFSQTVLQKEVIEGNSLKLKFISALSYKLKKENNYQIFYVPNYQNEGAPGDVKLPSQSVFISLPFYEKPEIRFSVIKKKEIKAIPEFNDFVTLEKEKLIYSKAKEMNNSKKVHFSVKGFLWIGNVYCMHLEITPAVFVSSQNKIELIKEFEVKLSFSKPIDANPARKTSQNKICANTSYELEKTKFESSIDTAGSWIDYEKQYVKIGVAKDGIYRITKHDLENLGVSTNTINPQTFKMFLKGVQIPIYVEGENDLSFDNSDFIEFVGIRNMGGHHREVSGFGKPYNEYLGRYTDTTVYWLTWTGTNGTRVNTLFGNEISTNDTLDYYSQIEHYEKNNWFDFSSASLVRREKPYWTENKTWHEGGLSVRVSNKKFQVSDVVPGKTFKMFAKFQDYASDISINAHFVSLGLNSDNWGDSLYLDKYQKIVLTNELSTDLLNNGNNNLSINSMPTEATINLCIFDWYEVEYPRYLIPYNDSLNFSFTFLSNINTPKSIVLKNIASNNYSLWRYGDKYVKYLVTKNGDRIIFADSVSSNSKFSFVDNSKIYSPKFYYLKQFVNLRNSNNKADYIAITHDKFIDQATEYCQFISENYGVVTKLINIKDIYDEFSYGFFNPEVIKDFLQITHFNWQAPVPKFVFLIGGATYDYYGYKNKNFGIKRVLNYVPSFGAPVSDNWFVTWDTTGAYIPQMNIGRITVTTNEEFEWYFEKHRNYISQKYNDWNKRYLFFSGGDENNISELTALKETNQFIIDNYVIPEPVGGRAEHFYKTVEPITNFGPYSQEYVNNAINNGGVFISYLGHSGTQTWDNSIISPEQLMNKHNRYPIVSDFGCSTGKFAEPDITSFSELFTLGSDGQALAYIGNSSLGFLSTSLIMPKLFYKNILKEFIHNVSEAHKQAKIEMLKSYGSSDVYQLSVLTNTYFGDPLLTLPIPTKPNFIIKEDAFELSGELITDLVDSTQIKIKYNNYGSVFNDYLTLKILHQFNNKIDTIEVKRKIPNFSDSLIVKIKTKKASGQHSLQVILDSQDKYDEIYENDNSAQFIFYVFSSSIRPLLTTQYLNGVKDKINFINSSSKPTNETIVLELTTDNEFTEKEIFEIKFDTVVSTLDLSELESGKRYFGRTKIKGDDNYSAVFSFITNGEKYYISDSLSFNQITRKNIFVKNNELNIDTTRIKLEVLSAGFSDGKTALLLKNGVDLIPNNALRGHHVAVIDLETYELLDYKTFDLITYGTSLAADYVTFLDTIKDNALVMFAIIDEGSVNLTTELRNKIKEYGSVYIDSIKFRSSWAFIGKRGAVPGSMPEAFSYEGEGSVTVDTTISFLADKGEIFTTEIGPSAKWNKLVINQQLPSNAKIRFTPIGIKTNGTKDTLASLTLQNSIALLDKIDAVNYPKLEIIATFLSSSDKQSPVLKSLGVDYNLPAELGTNYQVVAVDKDSVEQGENVNLSFYVYNVGESTADSFKVRVDLIKPDNSSQQIFEQIVDSIGSEQRKKFNVVFNTVSYKGEGQFNISIDTEDKILELYEDNNFYSIPFYVKGDTTKPSLNVTFDGEDIFEGEYISATPHIKIELNDPSLVPINDTSAISIFLNDDPVYYSQNQNSLNITFSNSNPKVVVNYKPTLDDGEYTLTVFGKDASGNVADSAGISKSFVVDNEAKMLNLYNYPNPFSSDTYFTFKLTQIPDEMNIKVYTIAGRLVKEIRLSGEELNYDFNRIYWDGRDEDGDLLANGVYIYKVIMYAQGKTQEVTQKLAIVR